MHIRRIQLAHVRGITALDLDLTQGPLPGLCVIAGPNGSGKTTVLEAAAAAILGMLNASAMMEDTDRLIQEGHAAATAQVWLDGAEEDWREERDLKGPFRVKVVWDREKGPRDHPPEGNHAFVLSQLWGAAALGARRRGWCLAGYGVQRFAAAAPLSEALMTAAPRRAALVTLFRRDASLLGAWAWLQKLGSPQAIFFGSDLDRDLERGLKGFARSLLADLLYAAGVTAHVQGAAVDFGATGVVVATRSGGVPLTALGSGTESLVLLVADILRQLVAFHGRGWVSPWAVSERDTAWAPLRPVCPMSGVILIDELENHLHPPLQRLVGPWLCEHFPNVQFIVTTHSPFICQSATDHKLFRMQGGVLQQVDEQTWRRVTQGTIDDAVMSDLFDMETPFSPKAWHLREELAELEGRILDGEDLSPEEDRRREEILAMLPDDVGTEVERLRDAVAAER